MRKFVQRGLLITAVLGVLMLASQSLATAAGLVSTATPGTGIPIVGGLIDSVVGIVTGTIYGVGGAANSVLASLTGGVL